MRVYSREFRLEVVRRILTGEKVPALSQELGIHRKLLYAWMRQVNEGGESNLRERGRPRKSEKAGTNSGSAPRQLVELEQKVAQQNLVIEFLTDSLRAIERLARHKNEWRVGIFQSIELMSRRRGGLSA